MRVGRTIGAAGLVGIFLAGPAASAVEPTRVATLGSDRFRQHGSVEALAWSPDQKQLVTSDTDTLHLWDAADGRRLWTITADNHVFLGLGFTADGKTLYASAESGGHTRLCRIDPARGKLLDNRLLLTAPAKGWFGPGATWLALKEMDDKRVWVVEPATGRVAWSDRAGDDDKFWAIAFRPDARDLAVADFSRRVRLVDPAAGKVVAEYKVGGGVIWNMAFSPDGKDLVAGISSPVPNHVLRFDAATGQVRWKREASRANELAFSPDGARVLYYGTRGTDRTEPSQWHWLDAATGGRTGASLDAGYVHTASVRPDGKVLAIGGFHGHITEWDLTTRQPLDASADPPEPVTDLRFSPDGTKVRGWAGGWYEWDTKTAKQTRLTPRLNAGASERVAVSDDQKWLAKVVGSGLGPQTAELIDLGTGKRRHTISGIGYRDRVRFLTDGRLSVLSPSGLRLFDPATGKPAGQVPAAESGDVAVSPDGRVAAVVARTDDGARVTRWDLAAGRNTAEWTGTVTHKGAVQFLIADLSADRRLLIQFTFAENQIVRRTRVGVFDLATGRRMSEWEPPLDVFTPVFSPDGRAVACLSAHAFGIEMRETATGGRRVPGSFAGFARACAFSPDGRTLAASGRLGPVELWDLAGRPAPRWADQSPADVWTGLASPDAERAFDAMAVLRAHPPEAVRLLTDRMKVLAPPDPDWTAARLKDLDATNFRRREQATKDLAAAGEAVLGALRGAQPTASAEAQERLARLIARAEAPSSHKLRAIRACEVLEGIGTPEARALLADWAKGAPGATLTREATESLERLKSR